MNLLEKFETVEVNPSHCISPEDKNYCERHQAAYEAALEGVQELTFFWEDMRKTQQELLGEGEYSVGNELTYLTFRNGLAITDTSLLNHIEGLHHMLVLSITHHFNTTYNMTLSESAVEEKLIPQEPRQTWPRDNEAVEAYHKAMQSLVLHYQDIVDLLILQMDGRTFAQQAFHELATSCHQAAWNMYQKKPKYECKKNVIRYTGYGCQVRNWGHSDEWQLQDDTKTILRGIAHFETGNYRTYPVGISDLLGYGYSYDNEHQFLDCKKLIQLKMFKNGRVDFKFSSETYAEEFARLYLGSVC